MSDAVQDALAGLRELGSVEQIQGRTREGLRPKVRPGANLHIHLPPNFSAFESVEQAVTLAAEQNVGVLGVGNYYNYSVYGDFATLARERGVFPIFGLEIISLVDALVQAGVRINDPSNPGRLYVCGKGITRFAEMTDRARELLGMIRGNDRERMAAMIGKLAAIFSEGGVPTGLTEEAIIDRLQARHGCPRDRITLQERHLAQAFQEVVFERVAVGQRAETLGRILGGAVKSRPDDHVAIQGQIRSQLMKAGKPAFVEERFVSFEQAYELILAVGGIPCYPTLADGTSPICEYEDPVEKLIEQLKALGIHCVELIPIRNQPQVLTEYVTAMREAGLVITAGTEHNTLDLLEIEPTCVGGAAVPDQIKAIFWEGACVVTAHQFVTLHGQCGFVDGQGVPNADYATAEERIAAFRSLGEAVLATYYGNKGVQVR